MRVLVRRKRHSLGITRLRVLRETFDENSLEMFIYDIPTRPKVMFGQLKMHEILLRPKCNWRKKYATEELTYIINLMEYNILLK